MRESDAKTNKYSDNYAINQCSLMVRVDNEELEVPLNFGMTSDEIKRLYPFILQFAAVPMKNPAVEFNLADDKGDFVGLSEEDRAALQTKANEQARYWYGKSEASVLDIAVRFALDIKLRGIAELADLFAPISPLELLDKQNVTPMTSEEAEEYIQEMGLETEVDREFDPGDEQDVPLGIGGQVHIDMYNPDMDVDYLSDELDEMESKLGAKDSFEETISKDINANGGTDRYVVERNSDASDTDGGLLSMYSEEDDSDALFDEMNDADGLKMDETTDLYEDVPLEKKPVDIPDDATETPIESAESSDDDDYDWDSEDDDFNDDEEA